MQAPLEVMLEVMGGMLDSLPSASGMEGSPQAEIIDDPEAPGCVGLDLPLPQWCTEPGGSSEEEDVECHICRMTAEESAEELVVPCACVTMPVHPSCRESAPPAISQAAPILISQVVSIFCFRALICLAWLQSRRGVSDVPIQTRRSTAQTAGSGTTRWGLPTQWGLLPRRVSLKMSASAPAVCATDTAAAP